jgi:biopolymer transport protein TolR
VFVKSERRNEHRLMNEINVVPYIDVMLVLLVIFMVTAPLMNPGNIDLPSVSRSLAPPVAPLEVIIKKDTSLALRDHSKGGGQESKVTRGELIAILKARQGAHADQAVVISADKNVRYEEVINVMDMLQQQNIKKVGLLTQAKAG